VIQRLSVLGFKTRITENEHQMLFTVDGKKFSVCTHHRGGSQLKACYVKDFLATMMDLGLYDD
jgi:hypothetical protein